MDIYVRSKFGSSIGIDNRWVVSM